MMTEQLSGDSRVEPVACTLTPDGVRDQVASWQELRGALRHVAVDERGATAWFDPTAGDALRAVVEREARCCAFLSLRCSADRSLVRVDIEADTEDGVAVAHLLASHASGQPL